MAERRAGRPASETVLFGGDPEFALTTDDGKPMGAWLGTTGTKLIHEKLLGDNDGWEVHADGVALELNFKPQKFDYFAHEIKLLYKFVVNAMAGKGLRLVPGVAVQGEYDASVLAHPLCQDLGCDPDFSAYRKDPTKPNDPPLHILKSNVRYFGGHFHVGYDQKLIPPWALVRLIEACAYLPVLAKDVQGDRRKIYGRAGNHRPKAYGVEWRTPGNFWVTDKGASDILVYNTLAVLEALGKEREWMNGWFHRLNWKRIQTHINEENSGEAAKLFGSIQVEFQANTGQRLYSNKPSS